MMTGRAIFAGVWAATAVAVLLLAGGRALAAEVCALPAAPRIIASEGESGAKGARLVQVWDVPDAAVYWSDANPRNPAYDAFVAGVARHVRVTDPVALLRASPAWGDPQLKRNNALVADHAAEWIKPAGCLEKLMLSVQEARVATFYRPTEFAVLVLRSPTGSRLRIYYLTVNEDGIGRVSPLTEPAGLDVKQGWRVVVVLHNHSFHPGQPSLDGVLAPSTADAQFAVNLAAENGLSAAWITNGLNTSRIPAEAFGLFTAPVAPVAPSAR